MNAETWFADFDKYISDNYPELTGYYNGIVNLIPNKEGYTVGIFDYSENFGTKEQYETAKKVLFDYYKDHPL